MRFNSTLDQLFIFTVILFLSQVSHARRNDVELFKDPQMLCILFFTMIGGVVICRVSLKVSKFTQKKGVWQSLVIYLIGLMGIVAILYALISLIIFISEHVSSTW